MKRKYITGMTHTNGITYKYKDLCFPIEHEPLVDIPSI